MTPEEFTRLQAEVAPRLWAWAALHLGQELRSTVDPDDVIQEATCRAWRRIAEYEPLQAPFAAWIFGIARNVLGELLGRMARGERAQSFWSTSSWAQLPDDATPATARVAKVEHLTTLVTWADSLEESDRLFILYRCLEGLSNVRTAEMLGISANAAQKRWVKLRARLQREPLVLGILEPPQGP